VVPKNTTPPHTHSRKTTTVKFHCKFKYIQVQLLHSCCALDLTATSTGAMSASATSQGAPSESEGEFVWFPYHCSVGNNVAAYFEVSGRGKKRKRKKCFVGKVVKYARPTKTWENDQLYHILWEDNDEEDYDEEEYENGRDLYSKMVLSGKLPFPEPLPTTNNGAPFSVIIEGIGFIPLHFLKRPENSGHDKSIQFNSNDIVDCENFFSMVERELYRTSTKVTLLAGALSTSTAAEQTDKLVVEAPLDKSAEVSFRVLVGCLDSIVEGFEPNSWQFRKHLRSRIGKLACSMRLLSSMSSAIC